MKNTEMKARQIYTGAALLALLAAAAVSFLFCSCSAEKPADVSEPTGIIYDESAVEGGWETKSREEIEASLNEKVAEGMINISMNTAPSFADGSAEGNLMIVNEEVNRYPQKVEILRNDTGETVYASNAIPVGSKIERARLSVSLPAGTYECTAYFHSLDPVTGNVIGTAGAVVTINIQN